MGTTENFVAQGDIVKAKIESELKALLSATSLKLPEADARISKLYVEKIQGVYNVGRAKQDTDAAVDLLNIAYNTTPQAQGIIRGKIGNEIMPALIAAQQKSGLAMRDASETASLKLDPLSAVFDDWLDVRSVKSVDDTAGVEGVKAFIPDELIDMAKSMKAEALKIKANLDIIAATYDKIIKDTAAVTSLSENALAENEDEKAALEDEINESNAKRVQLESLVTDLQREVDKYDKMARDYATRAATAEERAFIMSIVQVGAQMLAAAIPAIVTALTASATGGASVVAGAAASTVKRAVGDKNDTEDAAPPNDKKVIETKRKISEKKAEAEASKKKVDGLKGKVKGLEADLKKETDKKPTVPKKKPKKAPAGKDDGKTLAPDKSADDDEDDADDTPAVKELKKRVNGAKKELATETEKYEGLIAALSGLQASLKALEKGLGELTQTQQSEAADLRALQMKMLDKVEAYERERRTQNAELVKINALLKGKLSKAETITLTIRSLNLSIAALKRVQEIMTELGYFFLSFAAFMESVSKELDNDLERFENLVNRPKKLLQNAFNGLIATGDKFFIRQAAEWQAISFVTQTFQTSFDEGQSKLNKLRGKYYQGDELKEYLQNAAAKLEEIVAERDANSAQKIIDLNEYRQGMIESAMM